MKKLNVKELQSIKGETGISLSGKIPGVRVIPSNIPGSGPAISIR